MALRFSISSPFSPTNTPSDSPTRAFDQVLQSGSGPDLYQDTAKSFGNLFEVRTKSSAETVSIVGMDFYSSADAGTSVQYEVWTKEGTWQGFEGKIGKYTKIAEGRAKSKGACTEESAGPGGRRCNANFVQIPLEDFANVAIKGGGGSRSFYVTLKTKDIMYKRGEGGSSELLVQMETPGGFVFVFHENVNMMIFFAQENHFSQNCFGLVLCHWTLSLSLVRY